MDRRTPLPLSLFITISLMNGLELRLCSFPGTLVNNPQGRTIDCKPILPRRFRLTYLATAIAHRLRPSPYPFANVLGVLKDPADLCVRPSCVLYSIAAWNLSQRQIACDRCHRFACVKSLEDLLDDSCIGDFNPDPFLGFWTIADSKSCFWI